MIKINDKKTAIVGGIVGLVILLTVFCCEGKKAEAEAVEPKDQPTEMMTE